MLVCEGTIVQPVRIGVNNYDLATCTGGWSIVPYVEPTDSTAIYAQLFALNEFDPLKIVVIIVICFATFLVGFGTGIVLKLLRRL